MGSIKDNRRSIDSLTISNTTSEAALAAVGKRVLDIMDIYMCREVDAVDRSACCAKTHIVKRSLKIEDRDFLTRNIFENHELFLPILTCTIDELGQPRWHQDPRNRTARFTTSAPAISYFCTICTTCYSEEQVRLLPDDPDEGWDEDEYYYEDSEAEEYEESEAEEDEPDALDPLEEQEGDVIA